MKYPSIFFFLLLACTKCICQSANPNFSQAGSPAVLSGGISQAMNMINPSWRTTTIQAGANWNMFNGIQGNAFYNDNWQKGFIILQGNKMVKDVLLNYNIYTNQVFYFYDSQAYVLDASAHVLEFGICKREDSSQLVIFRCGFPQVENSTPATFYEVTVDSSITLLKHYNKSVIENVDASSGVLQKELFENENWYIYDRTKQKITAVRKNKTAVETALPEYKTIIESILQQINFKLKSEDELILLFKELNRRIDRTN